MGFFEDMTAAVERYPETYVELEIVEIDVPGDAINVSEIVNFRVKVTNTGPLHLDGVTLRIKGLNGATVASGGADAAFVAELVTQELPRITARGGSQFTVGRPLKFKAPGSAQESRSLVRAKLETWRPSLDNITAARSESQEDAPPKASYAAEVREYSTMPGGS
jgi:hypothetical protein